MQPPRSAILILLCVSKLFSVLTKSAPNHSQAHSWSIRPSLSCLRCWLWLPGFSAAWFHAARQTDVRVLRTPFSVHHRCIYFRDRKGHGENSRFNFEFALMVYTQTNALMRQKIPLVVMGVHAPILRTLDGSTCPPINTSGIFVSACAYKVSFKSHPIPQKSYP